MKRVAMHPIESGHVESAGSQGVVMKALMLICFGIYIGFISGLGFSFGKVEELAKRDMTINGDVIVNANKRPLSLSGINIHANGAEYGLMVVTK